MKNNKKLLLLLIMLGIILVLVGGTFAWFSYGKQGVKENTIKSGAINFHYEEGNRSISVDNVLPMTDAQGKAQTNYFEFDITSSTSDIINIPYYITARKTDDSDNIDSIIKVYLTKVDNNGNETQVALGKYNELNQYTNSDIDLSNYIEKLVYRSKVYAGTQNYEQKYRLRMWISDDAEFLVQNNGTDTYPYQDKHFTLTVNVYSNGVSATSQEVTDVNNTGIRNVDVNNDSATVVDDTSKDYDFYKEVPYGTPSVEIEIETVSFDATVNIVNVTPTVMNNQGSYIKRLSTKLEVFDLVEGDNFYKITVRSANNKNFTEYILKVTVQKSNDAKLSSLSLSDCDIGTFNPDITNYSCITEEASIITTVTPNYNGANAVVTGGSNLTLGSNIVSVLVTAEDGITQNTYTITVTRNEKSSMLMQAIYDKYASGSAENVPNGPASITGVETGSGGLYKSTSTNSGNPTYYFRGNVVNNYVSFAGFIWRIVRINEDGTIRLIMQNGINDDKTYVYHNDRGVAMGVYYTQYSGYAKTNLETWYNTNLNKATSTNVNKKYIDYIAINGNYFCEQAKVKPGNNFANVGNSSMILYSKYTPTFQCVTDDGNNKGIVNTAIGLITYDEAVYAGGYYNVANSSYYLNNGSSYSNKNSTWTMSPAGQTNATVWFISCGKIGASNTSTTSSNYRAVINLNSTVRVTGTGTSATPWTVVYN